MFDGGWFVELLEKEEGDCKLCFYGLGVWVRIERYWWGMENGE